MAELRLFQTVPVYRITEHERYDDRREFGQYKNYLQFTKVAHILVIIRNCKQKRKKKKHVLTPKPEVAISI